MTTEQVYAKDQTKIHLKKWILPNEIKGSVLLIHGLGEHSGRYTHVAEYLNTLGYDVFAYDQRGHGQTDGQRAYAKSHQVFLDDLGQVIMHLEKELHERFFVMGHSFGGNVLCSYMIGGGHPKIKGLVFSSAWFKLAFEPPKFKVLLANMLKGILPRLSMSNELKIEDLAYDQQCIDAYETDPLVHNKITASLFVNAYNAGLHCLENGHLIRVPTLVYHGEDDQIISPSGSKMLAGKIEGSTFKMWEKTKHEPHNDERKQEVLVLLGGWLDKQ